MRENFALAIGFVLKHEGGYSNDPNDPGGETNFGISKRYHPDVDIKNLDVVGAAKIYLNSYWIPAGCDALEFPKDVVMLDTSVNPGTGIAATILGESSSWQEMLMRREAYYIDKIIETPAKLIYFFGWTQRIMDLHQLIETEIKQKAVQ